MSTAEQAQKDHSSKSRAETETHPSPALATSSIVVVRKPVAAIGRALRTHGAASSMQRWAAAICAAQLDSLGDGIVAPACAARGDEKVEAKRCAKCMCAAELAVLSWRKLRC